MLSMDQINNLMTKGLEAAAQMSIGQAVLRLCDKMMWVVEKSAQWNIPIVEENSENGKTFGPIEHTRPLPWILFLPGLMILRLVRASLNIGAIIFSYPKIEPIDMVRLMQKYRRRLRAIKSTGLKSMRQKRSSTPEQDPKIEEENANKSFNRSMSRSANNSYVEGDSKRKYDELLTDEEFSSESEEEEPLVNKIDRYANEETEVEDKDYVPVEEDVSRDTVMSESETNISLKELENLIAEKEEMEKIVLSATEDDVPNSMIDNDRHTETESFLVEKTFATGTAESGNSEDSENSPPANGVKSDQEIAFFSPVSWKSISSDNLLSPSKQEDDVRSSDGDIEKPVDHCDRELSKADSNKEDHNGIEHVPVNKDSTKNGQFNNEKKSNQQTGKSNYNKNKKNHGYRKKK